MMYDEMKKAVVDIDNTLWAFSEALYPRLRDLNPRIPPPHEWTDWDFWERHVSLDEFRAVIMDIHVAQDSEAHVPYAEAAHFLASMREAGHYVVIASHRDRTTMVQTERWLIKHGLTFDELHLSFDKTVLFNSDCLVVVDDAPDILAKAAERGVLATGILCPWNSLSGNGTYRLFPTLGEVLSYILMETGS